MAKKRALLWDWKNTNSVPWMMDKVNFNVISSASNWNTWVPPELKGRVPYRPMVRGETNLQGDEWKMIENSDQPIIHFFNEPERAGITPEHAADVWNRQMLPLRRNKGKKLVSPSCANDGNGQAWINEWMGLVASNPPDFLGLHYYGIDTNAMVSFLQQMHNRHPGKPVIVSEWACISRDFGDVNRYTVRMVNWMDETGWIFEHSLFGCMPNLADGFVSPAAQLMRPDGSFTDLFLRYQSSGPMRL